MTSLIQFSENDGLTEADILYLMNEEDSQHSGFLDLNILKQRLDNHINESQLRLQLVSKIKEIVEEAVVDDTDTIATKRGKLKKSDVSKPSCFDFVTMDLACAIFLKRGESVDTYFAKYGTNNQLSKPDFIKAFKDLRIRVKSKKDMNEYFMFWLDLQEAS
jgi:hypothetical protein